MKARTEVHTNFNLDKHLVQFLQSSPFMAQVSQVIRKVATHDLPTAGVAYNPATDEIVLYWNPDFMASLTEPEVMGILAHELYHVILLHITARKKTKMRMWNVAADLAINSIIIKSDGYGSSGSRTLPACGLIPGQMPRIGLEAREMTAEEKAASPAAALIASFPHLQSADWYYDELNKLAKEERKKALQKAMAQSDGGGNPSPGNGEPDESGGEGDGGAGGDGDEDGDIFGDIGTMDEHDWDDLTEEEREYLTAKIKHTLDKAARHADSQSRGWGSIPAEVREHIRSIINGVIDWRKVLRQFVGTLITNKKKSTLKRINKRYPYIHPGTNKTRTANLLLAIDQSGSVDDAMLCEFFGEIESLNKQVTINVVHFDCTVDENSLTVWRKGSKREAHRTRGGGTNFDAPTEFANDPKNRGRWDGLIILTDGMAPRPGSSRIKRAWVLGKGQKLEFNTEELVLRLDQKNQDH